MNHLAFRRDTADEQLAVQFAVQVGSPEVLQMLYVLTAADLAAVGPDVWDGWKLEVVTDLYHRTMQHLAGESPETTIDDLAGPAARGGARVARRGNAASLVRRAHRCLAAAYLNATPPEQAAADLRLLHDIASARLGGWPERSQARGRRRSVSARNGHGPIHRRHVRAHRRRHFLSAHRALSSHGLRNPLGPDPHAARRTRCSTASWFTIPTSRASRRRSDWTTIQQSLVEALLVPQVRAAGVPPHLARWAGIERCGCRRAHRVNIDNSTSRHFTIIDIFTHDRTGLLYAIARTLFELGLSVGRAKIGTFLDQVVDVFYVTDRDGRKIEDEQRLGAIRQRLLEVVAQEAG